MEIDFQETSTKKTLRIEIPKDIAESKYAEELTHLQKGKKIPGFRPGKTPLSIIEKKYGVAVWADMIGTLMLDYYFKIVEAQGIKPVGTPQFQVIASSRNVPISYSVTTEVIPAITLREYRQLPVSRSKITVSDGDVERLLLRIQDQHGNMETYPHDHLILINDYVTVDMDVLFNGAPVEGEAKKEMIVRIGAENTPTEFTNALLGQKKEGQFSLKIVLPADYSNPQIAGKEVDVLLDIHEVKHKILPLLDDEFAKDLGLDSLSLLKDDIRKVIYGKRKQLQEEAEKASIIDQLIQLHPVEVPPSLLSEEIEELLDKLEKNLGRPINRDQIRTEYEPGAKRRVQGRLILDAIGEAESLSVEDRDVSHEISRIARATSRSLSDVHQRVYGNKAILEEVKQRVITHKAFEWVYANAKFEEKEEEFVDVDSNGD